MQIRISDPDRWQRSLVAMKSFLVTPSTARLWVVDSSPSATPFGERACDLHFCIVEGDQDAFPLFPQFRSGILICVMIRPSDSECSVFFEA